MKMKGFLRNLFFITLPSILVFFIFLEVSLRAGGYLYTRYRHPETYAKMKFSRPDTFNILCLGDSLTEGFGASRGSGYPAQLEQLLHRNNFKNINIFNGGRCGNVSSVLLNELEKNIEIFHPNLIIVLIGINNYGHLIQNLYFLNKTQKIKLWLYNNIRTYKLITMGWESFKSKIVGKKNLSLSSDIMHDTPIYAISPISMISNKEGEEILYSGLDSNLAIEKFNDAVKNDANNYIARMWLVYLYIHLNKYDLAKKELDEAISAIDRVGAWHSSIYRVVELIMQLRQVRDKNDYLLNLKTHFKSKYTNRERGEALIKIVDTALRYLKTNSAAGEMLKEDLAMIIMMLKQKKIYIILQTYPFQTPVNDIIREVAKRYNLMLIDNDAVFKEKLKSNDRQMFFTPYNDGHCNANGYGLIAENCYSVLLQSGLLSN